MLAGFLLLTDCGPISSGISLLKYKFIYILISTRNLDFFLLCYIDLRRKKSYARYAQCGQ